MKIDLREFPTYYINLDTATEKREQTEKVLSSLGFSNVNRISGTLNLDPKVGCAESHYRAMCSLRTPFLLLEDDVVPNSNQFVYDIPTDADALYVGATQWGRYLNHSGPFVHYKKISDDVVRTYNMLATHAVLYLNDGFREHLSRIAKHAAYESRYHLDVGYAETQKYYNVYATDLPFFTQMGYNNKVTSRRISEMATPIDESTFEVDKWNLTPLSQKKDLNGISGFYDPRFY